jgi:hypothetical protein
MKLVFKPLLNRRVLDRVRERKLKRRRKADVLQHRWAEVFANAAHLL